MSLRRFCDRCGREFADYTAYTTLTMARTLPYFDLQSPERELGDFCDRCVREISEFASGKEDGDGQGR